MNITTLTRPVFVAVAVVAASLTGPGLAPARADPWGHVHCDTTPSAPECTVTAIDAHRAGHGAPALTCRIGDHLAPCYIHDLGWLGTGGCYYGQLGNLAAPLWKRTCSNPALGKYAFADAVFLLAPPPALTVMIKRAISELRIPPPVIATNPALAATQVVHVPVWWWVQPAGWQTQTATAAIPGFAVTAYATPQKITWDAGDGASIVCNGPGTPWSPRYPPAAASPTCGHTYTATSRTHGGTFTLRATISWNITWTGPGLNGNQPALATTAVAPVAVTELRSVITH